MCRPDMVKCYFFLFLFFQLIACVCTLRQKQDFLVFTRIYVCVKAKLTFVVFPYFFPFPISDLATKFLKLFETVVNVKAYLRGKVS